MTRHWGTLLLLGLTLTVAGCVRTAGTPFEPVTLDDTGATSVAEQPTATALPVDLTEEATPLDASAQGENTTPTDVPITIVAPTDTPTVIPPTETLLPNLQVTDTPTDTPPTDVPTEAPTVSAPATAITDGVDTQVAPLTATDSELPSGPSGPVDIVPNTPVPAPTTAAPASDLLPTPTAFGETTDDGETIDTDNTDTDDDECTYTVRAGDNAFRIAVNNNITLNQLRQANPGQLIGADPVIQPGDVLEIPGCGEGTVTRTPAPSPTPTGEAVVEDDTIPEADDAAPTPPEGFIAYEVRSGDTLIAIARRYGTTINELVDVNNLTNPDILDAGDVLFVPDPNAN